MITPGVEAQQKAKDALRRVDQAIRDDLDKQDTIKQQAEAFRDTFFGCFDYMERETMLLEEVFVKMNRIDANQLEVQNKQHPPFLLVLDTELSYDNKPLPGSSSSGEKGARWAIELGARLFAVFKPPLEGLLRSYTIYADGSWKRTTFTLSANVVQAQSALLPKHGADMLILEAIDLLGYVCTLHPTWANLAPVAETFTADMLQKRNVIKTHLTGLGAGR